MKRPWVDSMRVLTGEILAKLGAVDCKSARCAASSAEKRTVRQLMFRSRRKLEASIIVLHLLRIALP